jgi:hypothetical protein
LALALRGALAGFLEAIGFALDGDNLGVVDQPIDQGDDTGGVGKDLVPLAERSVGGDEDGFFLVATADDLEQQVGVTIGVGEAVVNNTVWPSRTASWAMLRAMVDLPTPLGPTSTALAASATKPRRISSSMLWRSHWAGQFQSKSARGLKRPRRALAKRRSRPRRARSCSSQPISGSSHSAAAISSQCASSP